jgi:hypothetical protein
MTGDAYAVVSNGSYGNAAIQTNVSAVGSAVTAVSAKIGTPAGASVSADIAEVEGETDAIIATLGAPVTTIAGDIAAIGLSEGDVKSINGSTDAAVKLGVSAKTMATGTVDTSALAPTNTQFDTDLITGVTGHWDDRWLVFTSGTLAGQAKPITGYQQVAGRGRFLTQAFAAVPANTDAFVIV